MYNDPNPVDNNIQNELPTVTSHEHIDNTLVGEVAAVIKNQKVKGTGRRQFNCGNV